MLTLLIQYAAGVKIVVVQAEKNPMSSRAVKFLSRSPRYTLSPADDKYMRFAHQNNSTQSYTTRIVDISQTGLSFICDHEMAPRISELIKVEIPLNDQDQPHTVAWWARVVRVEEFEPHKWYLKKAGVDDTHSVFVAITFHDLPPGHSKSIRNALDKKFSEIQSFKAKKHLLALVQSLFNNFFKILFFAATTAIVGWILYLLAQPSVNYDPSKGAPWGERFKGNWFLTPGKPEK